MLELFKVTLGIAALTVTAIAFIALGVDGYDLFRSLTRLEQAGIVCGTWTLTAVIAALTRNK